MPVPISPRARASEVSGHDQEVFDELSKILSSHGRLLQCCVMDKFVDLSFYGVNGVEAVSNEDEQRWQQVRSHIVL